jgi:mRNA-degrading endonuclease RelE of RelBE toxin-antitoxin system
MEIRISEQARKQYKKLSKIEQRKVAQKIQTIVDNPYVGKKLAGELDNRWSIRAWPYRVLYRIDKKQKSVEIISIAHRQGVYK